MIQLDSHFKKIESQINSLPDKLNFKIGEAGKIVGAPSHVLRYWEKELPILKPEKFTNKQRLYSKKDIRTLLLIKALLYKEKLSIESLRKHLPSYCRQFKLGKNKALDLKPIKQKAHRLLSFISQMRAEINRISTHSP